MQVIALLAGFALGADPLVATGPVPDALRQVAAGAGRPESSFDAATWAEVVGAGTGVIGDGEWLPCGGGAATLAQLTLAVEGAESALGYGAAAKATAEVGEADRLAACLVADPPSALLARWHLARAAATGDDRSLALARALDPSIRWGASWPDDGGRFQAAGAPAEVPVAVRAWGEARVDGAPASATLGPGLHVVRAGAVSGLLSVRDEPIEVVLASAFPSAAPSNLSDPAIREDTAALFLVRYGAGARVFLADADEAWATTAGRTDWTSLRKVRRSPLVPIGAAVAAPGAVGGVVALALARGAHADVGEAAERMTLARTTPELAAARVAYDEGSDRYRTWNTVAAAAGGVGAIGVGLLTVGLARGEIEVRAAVSPTGSATLAVRR